MSTPDLFGNLIAPDGSVAGCLSKQNLFFAQGTSPILQSPSGQYWQLQIDDNGVTTWVPIMLTQNG